MNGLVDKRRGPFKAPGGSIIAMENNNQRRAVYKSGLTNLSPGNANLQSPRVLWREMSRFKKINEILNANFTEPDTHAFRVILGAIRSHYFDGGDPPWLFVVAPPGSGKTALNIMAASGLPQIKAVGDVTPASFLSGHSSPRPGLLEQLGEPEAHGSVIKTQGNAIFTIKDFTTVLSMPWERQAEILAQLREIYDGSFTRSFGTGKTKHWSGRVSIIAAVTPVIDRSYSVFRQLGERFLQIRLPRPPRAAGLQALQQRARENKTAKEVQGAVAQIFWSSKIDDSLKLAPEHPTELALRLSALSWLIATARTHVFRQKGKITDLGTPEANTRISRALDNIVLGIATLEGREVATESDLQDSFRVALDCLPALRRDIIATAISGGVLPDGDEFSRSARSRCAEELVALGVLQDRKQPFLFTPEFSEVVNIAQVNQEHPKNYIRDCCRNLTPEGKKRKILRSSKPAPIVSRAVLGDISTTPPNLGPISTTRPDWEAYDRELADYMEDYQPS